MPNEMNRWGIPWLGSTSLAIFVTVVALTFVPDRLTLANYGVDGGDLLAAVLTGGVPHPTGYPTYVLLGMLFQCLPWGNVYERGVLLSALPAALSAGLLVAWLAFQYQKDGKTFSFIPTILVGLAWGLSPLLLSQAVIVEVHGLHVLFVMLSIVWVWLLLDPKGGRKGILLAGLALLYGLGLGNHLTLFLLLPGILLGFRSAHRNGLESRWILAQVTAIFVGMLVYIYLPLSARHYPPVNWGNPQTWEGFLWVVSGQPYQGLFLSSTPGLVERMVSWFTLLRQQYGLLGLALGSVGAVLAGGANKRLALFLGWVFLSFSVLAVFYHTADSAVYLLPAFMVWAIWIHVALQAAWMAHRRLVPWGIILCLVFCTDLLARFPQIYHQVDPRRDTRLDEFVRTALEITPQGALFLTQSDPDTFSLWYYRFGLQERADIAVISLPLTAYRWYQETLLHTYPHLQFPEVTHDGDLTWGEMIVALNPERAVCRSKMIVQAPLTMKIDCQPSIP
jgi:hypothetical protein